jgi:hypothetical protein
VTGADEQVHGRGLVAREVGQVPYAQDFRDAQDRGQLRRLDLAALHLLDPRLRPAEEARQNGPRQAPSLSQDLHALAERDGVRTGVRGSM